MTQILTLYSHQAIPIKSHFYGLIHIRWIISTHNIFFVFSYGKRADLCRIQFLKWGILFEKWGKLQLNFPGWG